MMILAIIVLPGILVHSGNAFLCSQTSVRPFRPTPSTFSQLWSKQDQDNRGPKKKKIAQSAKKSSRGPTKTKSPSSAASPAKPAKPAKAKKVIIKGESWIDKEERLATEAYGVFLGRQVAKKERMRERELEKREQYQQQQRGRGGPLRDRSDTADSPQPQSSRDRSLVGNEEESRGADQQKGARASGRLAPWERPEDDDGSFDADDGKLLKNARSVFSLAQVNGFEFVGGFGFEELPALGLPEVAFLGRSNVGKSSCLNSLAGPGQRPALVSKMPGRTQRINLFRCGDQKSSFMCFADLPGYGYAKIAKRVQEGIEDFLQKYLEGRRELGLVVLLVDSRLPPQATDMEVLNAFRALGLPHLVVATKVDKLPKQASGTGGDYEVAMAGLRQGLGLGDDEGPLPYSAATGVGRKELWNILRDSVLAMQGFAVDPNGRVVKAETIMVAENEEYDEDDDDDFAGDGDGDDDDDDDSHYDDNDDDGSSSGDVTDDDDDSDFFAVDENSLLPPALPPWLQVESA
mmetsp:Transcript_77911/g.152448  ORF Transcript_77911/g.152448 Transcript_77911/m.152448 type:complete len:518 (+) Transcript_77911:86-1639(+)